jgi:signal transduction histidine kinase
VPTERSALLVSTVLQGTAALTFGLAFLGMWRGFRREAARWWAIAWLAYACGVINTASQIAFGYGAAWGALALGLLQLPLIWGVLLFRAGTDALNDRDRSQALRPYAIACGLVGGLVVIVHIVTARLGLNPAVAGFLMPRLIMAGAYAWAARALFRRPRHEWRPGFALLAGVLILLSLRMLLAAGFEALQIAGGSPRQPESLILTIAQISLLVVFGVATVVVLIEDEAGAQRRLERVLFQTQRLDSLGRMAGGTAHDFNNMLMAIVGAADLAKEHLASDSPALPYLDMINDASNRGNALTRELLTFARQLPVTVQRFDARDRVASLQTMVNLVAGRHVRVAIVGEQRALPVQADPTQFDQVILNLVINARDAMPSGGKLTIRTSLATAADDEAPRPTSLVRVAIEDTGAGIPAAILDRIFEPFFTTKPDGQGTGLGLSSAYGFARQAGGKLSVESTEGVGTRFTLDLPLAS